MKAIILVVSLTALHADAWMERLCQAGEVFSHITTVRCDSPPNQEGYSIHLEAAIANCTNTPFSPVTVTPFTDGAAGRAQVLLLSPEGEHLDSKSFAISGQSLRHSYGIFDFRLSLKGHNEGPSINPDGASLFLNHRDQSGIFSPAGAEEVKLNCSDFISIEMLDDPSRELAGLR